MCACKSLTSVFMLAADLLCPGIQLSRWDFAGTGQVWRCY